MTGSLFISFEGIDGSGKSTQASLLASALRDRGFPIVHVREPGGTPVGERIREILFDAEPPRPLTMALLYAGARSELVERVIRPALAAGKVVVADRYSDSTLAYQGFGQGLDLDNMRALVRVATGGLRPDIIIYLDVAGERTRGRLEERTDRNHLDDESSEFQDRVRTGYELLIEAERSRWRRIAGEGEPHEVHCAVMRAVEPVLRKAYGDR